jgi:hypothetical protein
VSQLGNKPIIDAVWEALCTELRIADHFSSATMPTNPEEQEFTTEFYQYLSSKAASAKVMPFRFGKYQGGLKYRRTDTFQSEQKSN